MNMTEREGAEKAIAEAKVLKVAAEEAEGKRKMAARTLSEVLQEKSKVLVENAEHLQAMLDMVPRAE